MKNIINRIGLAALTLTLATTASAQPKPEGAPDSGAPLARHVAEVYAKVAPYDANQDGKLNETERRALGQDMIDGKLKAPKHRGGNIEDLPHPGVLIQRIAMLYTAGATHDADDNGKLNAAEQASLQKAIESGAFRRGGPPTGRPGR